MRKITFNEKMRKMKLLTDTKSYYQSSNNMYTYPSQKERNKSINSSNKTFGLESKKMTGTRKSNIKAFSDSKNSLSPSASSIYQNNFYQSNYNNYRDNVMNLHNSNNSNSSSMRDYSHMKRPKLKKRDPRSIKMKVTRLNASSHTKINSKSNTRIVGRRKLLHNIKIKHNKNDLQSIMTIKNPQFWFRNTNIKWSSASKPTIL